MNRLRRRNHRAPRALAGIVVAMAVILILPTTARAITLWSFVGKVTDPLGTPIAGATVSDGTQQTTTAADGTYSLGENSPGTYALTAQATNHAAQTQRVPGGPLNTTANFDLPYDISGALGPPAISTASGQAISGLTITSWAPSAGVSVVDSRTGQPAQATLLSQNKDGSSTWTYQEVAPQNTTEGNYTLSYLAADWATGTQMSTTGSSGYIIDNTPPTLSDPIPGNLANIVTFPQVVSAFATDTGSGLNTASASIEIDGQPQTNVATTNAAAGAVVHVQISTLSQGPHTVLAKIADNAGNAQLFTWQVVVTGFLAATSAPVAVPANTTAAVGVYKPGDTVSISNVALDLGATSFSMPQTGHAGYGLLCGTINLSNLEAQFTSVTGGPLYAQPNSPPPGVVCAYVSDLSTDASDPYSEVLAGWAPALGTLTFQIPTGTAPNSKATLVFNGNAPTLNWAATTSLPSYAVPAAPGGGVMESISDPVPNVIDARSAAAARADLDQREASMVSAGNVVEGSDIEPSLWAVASGKYQQVGSVVDRATLYPSAASEYSASLTPASPYSAPTSASVLYRNVTLFAAATPSGVTSNASTIEQYFRWDNAYTGLSGGGTYLPLTWSSTTAPDTQNAASDHLFDLTGQDVTNTTDDSGHAVSSAQSIASSNTYGEVVGFEQAFNHSGAQDSVRSGWTDEPVNLTCAYCQTYSNIVQDTSQADSFQVASTGGPAVNTTSSSAVAGEGVSPQGYANCVDQSGTPSTCKPLAGSSGPNTVTLSVSPGGSVAIGTPATLTATANGDVGSSPFYLEIADQTTRAMIKICPSGSTCTVTATQTTQTTHTYLAYVAGYNQTNPPPEIQAQSAAQPVSWVPWTVTLTDSSTGAVPTGYPATFTVTTNGNVASASAWIDLYDTTTNTLVGAASSGDQLSVPVRQSASGTHSYIAYVASSDPSSAPSTGVYGTSSQVSQTWDSTLWTVSLSANSTSIANSGNAYFTATASYDVGETGFFIDVFDQTNNSPVGDCNFGTVCTEGAEGGFQNTTHTFVSYVADGFTCPGGCANSGPPSNIQATSNVLSVSWGSVYTIALSAGSTSLAAGQSTSLTATANQSVSGTVYWIQIFDSSTGEQITACNGGSSCSTTISVQQGEQQSYVAYVGYDSTTVPPANLQATSNVVTVTWSVPNSDSNCNGMSYNLTGNISSASNNLGVERFISTPNPQLSDPQQEHILFWMGVDDPPQPKSDQSCPSFFINGDPGCWVQSGLGEGYIRGQVNNNTYPEAYLEYGQAGASSGIARYFSSSQVPLSQNSFYNVYFWGFANSTRTQALFRAVLNNQDSGQAYTLYEADNEVQTQAETWTNLAGDPLLPGWTGSHCPAVDQNGGSVWFGTTGNGSPNGDSQNDKTMGLSLSQGQASGSDTWQLWNQAPAPNGTTGAPPTYANYTYEHVQDWWAFGVKGGGTGTGA